MRAQKAEEPTMEEILSSIRKIISEDNEDNEVENTAASENGPYDGETGMGQNIENSVPQPQLPSHHQLVPDSVTDRSPENGPDTQKPSVLVERREYLESKIGSDSLTRSVQPETEISKPAIKPASLGVPLTTVKLHAESNAPKAPDYQSGPPQPNQIRDNNIPGFVEDKPDISGIRDSAVKTPQGSEAPLHPAIANAKSFVRNQESGKKISPVSGRPETPVFTETSPSSVALPMEPLISPESAERRLVDERRNHPLRRGADRDDNQPKSDLMSAQTNNSVHSAFERLKNMTTENLDSNVNEIIRPMLREWLDNNLPSMVERLVRDEIERVSRGE